MARVALFEFLEDDSLTLDEIPQNDGTVKSYTRPSPTKDEGLWMKTVATFGNRAFTDTELTEDDIEDFDFDALTDKQKKDLSKLALGPVWQQLLDDKVSWERIRRIGLYVFTYYAFSPANAREAAENGVLTGEAQRPNRETRRAQARQVTPRGATRKASTASANTTRKRASTASSATPARKRARKAAAKSASRGSSS